MKSTILFILLLCTLNFGFSQDILKGSKIDWQDLEESMKNNPYNKNYLVFIYADWCEYCQKTTKTTLSDYDFIQSANNNFIPVKLNANSFEPIHILNTDFTYDEASGYHGLPIVLLEGKMEFPSYVFLTPEFTMISKISGYQENTKLLTRYMDYISSNSYKTVTWEKYKSTF